MSIVVTGKLEKELSMSLRDFSREECGLTAIIGNVERSTITEMMESVFHRGESGYGFYIGDLDPSTNYHLSHHILASSFNEKIDNGLGSDTSIFMGHCRYPTSGGKASLSELQPFTIKNRYGEIILAHNGNIENQEDLRATLPSDTSFKTSSDSELFLHLISNSTKKNFESALIETLNTVKRAFSLLVLHKDNKGQETFYAIKDIEGIRPLDYHFNGTNLFVSSENQAFSRFTNGQYSSLEPSQMLKFRIGEDLEIIDYNNNNNNSKPKPCVFEWIYFQNPNNLLKPDSPVTHFREDLGRQLYKEIASQITKRENSLVVPILNSGKFSAQGFSKESSIEYKEVILLNDRRSRQRSFTAENDEDRRAIIRDKFIFINSDISGKDLYLVDDSIVRGNTSKILTQILKEIGANSVHYLSASPQIVSTCPYGMDFHTKQELITFERDLGQIRREIGVDSIHYLSFEGLKKVARGYQQNSFCSKCFKE